MNFLFIEWFFANSGRYRGNDFRNPKSNHKIIMKIMLKTFAHVEKSVIESFLNNMKVSTVLQIRLTKKSTVFQASA